MTILGDPGPIPRCALNYALIAGTILSFGIALLGLVEELLGWWNDVGEAFMYLGTAAGLALAATTAVIGSTRSQVDETTQAVEDNGVVLHRMHRRLGGVDDQLGGVDEKLDSVDQKMSKQTIVLEKIHDKL